MAEEIDVGLRAKNKDSVTAIPAIVEEEVAVSLDTAELLRDIQALQVRSAGGWFGFPLSVTYCLLFGGAPSFADDRFQSLFRGAFGAHPLGESAGHFGD